MSNESFRILAYLRNKNRAYFQIEEQFSCSLEENSAFQFLLDENFIEYANYSPSCTTSDKNKEVYKITEKGRSVVDDSRRQTKQRWLDRLCGFITGVLLTVLAWFLSTI